MIWWQWILLGVVVYALGVFAFVWFEGTRQPKQKQPLKPDEIAAAAMFWPILFVVFVVVLLPWWLGRKILLAPEWLARRAISHGKRRIQGE